MSKQQVEEQVEAVPSAVGLFSDTNKGPRLLGSVCSSCEAPYFPRAIGCHNPDCDDSRMKDATFGPRGRIWSLSIQNYPPPPPVVCNEPFTPFAVGMVDLPEGLRVLGRLLCDDPDAVQVGDEVELVIAPLGRDETGRDVLSWQFKPV